MEQETLEATAQELDWYYSEALGNYDEDAAGEVWDSWDP